MANPTNPGTSEQFIGVRAPIITVAPKPCLSFGMETWISDRLVQRTYVFNYATGGTLTGLSSPSATIEGLGDIIGTISATASPSGTIEGLGSGNASAAGIAASNSTIEGLGSIAGTIPGLNTDTGTIEALGSASGLASGLAGSSANLGDTEDFIGSSYGTSSVVGTIEGLGYIAGSSHGIAPVFIPQVGYLDLSVITDEEVSSTSGASHISYPYYKAKVMSSTGVLRT